MNKIATYKQEVGTFIQRLAEAKVYQATGMCWRNPMFKHIAEGMVDTVHGSPDGIKGWAGLNSSSKIEIAEAVISLKEIKSKLLSKSMIPVIESMTNFLSLQNSVMTDSLLERSDIKDVKIPTIMEAASYAIEGVIFIESTKELRVKLQEAITLKNSKQINTLTEEMKRVKAKITEVAPASPWKSFQMQNKKSPEFLKYYQKKAEHKGALAAAKGEHKKTMSNLKAQTPRGDMKSGKLYNKYKDPVAIAHMQKTAQAKDAWKAKKAALNGKPIARAAKECSTRP
jgi:hypothetical protein